VHGRRDSFRRVAVPTSPMIPERGRRGNELKSPWSVFSDSTEAKHRYQVGSVGSMVPIISTSRIMLLPWHRANQATQSGNHLKIGVCIPKWVKLPEAELWLT